MEYIDLYDIHDTVFEKRPECNQCPSHRGESVEDAESVQLEAMTHEGCPFVAKVVDDVDNMINGIDGVLTVDFINEVMELDLNNSDLSNVDYHPFNAFIFRNGALLEPKLTEFFVKRLRDENNYRGVNVQVS